MQSAIKPNLTYLIDIYITCQVRQTTRGYRDQLIIFSVGAGVVTALLSTSRFTTDVAVNVAVQLLLFAAVAAVPAHRTGKMSYVDVAWPWGLVAIGVELLALGDGGAAGKLLAALIYLVTGLRMGLPGLLFLLRHHSLPVEFPRYRYQRLRWEAAGHRSEAAPMQLEIFQQAVANASALAVPGLLVAFDSRAPSPVMFAGAAIWLASWSLEGLADRQKRAFAAAAAARGDRTAVCDEGLWRYSRHPNYFFQWMGWNGLALAAVPSLVHLRAAPVSWALIGLGLLAAPAFMLWTLVSLTGIRPSEHYSLQKRPGYRRYRETTSALVPRRRREPRKAGPAFT